MFILGLSFNLNAQKLNFTASKRNIQLGASTTLSWHVRWANKKDSIFIQGIDGVVNRKGEITVTPESDTRYILTVKRKGKYIKKQIRVKVTKPEIFYFTGLDSIPANSTLSLIWQTKNAHTVEIENEASFLPHTGSFNLIPTKPTEYTLKACNKNGFCTKAVHKVKISGDYASGPSILKIGESGMLEWHFKDAIEVSIEGIDEKLPASGTKKISPNETKEYKFNVKKKNETGEIVNISATVKVPVVRSAFIKGVKDYVTLASGRKLIFDIFAVNWQNFPEEIRLRVMITDTIGNYITGLAPPHISEADSRKFFKTIIETVEDTKYTINDFTVNEIRSMTSTPHDISLVLDYSGSMSSYFSKMDKVTRNFISKKHTEDRLGIVRFDDSVGVESPLKKNSSELLASINFNGGSDYCGSTALYAAADAGMQLLSDSLRSRQLILMTDGYENSSMFYWGTYFTFASEVINEARKKHISITTIDFGGSANTPLLEALADMSGGNNYQLKNPDDIDKVFTEMQHLYHNYYEIVYKPANKNGDRIIDLVYNDNTNNLATTRAFAYVSDTTNIEAIENDGIINNTSFKNTTYKNLKIINRQTVALFEFNKTFIDEPSKNKLDVVIKYLKSHPEYKVVVLGYSDLKGDEKFCNRISNERAHAVYNYLRKKGIASSRISYEGKGKTEPVWAVEDLEWKAQENRRVDILYLKK